MVRIKDLTGHKFERLSVLKLSHIKNGDTYWNVICDCGVKKYVRSDHLTGGKVKSCGCLARELKIKLNTTHGGSATREYRCWESMRDRCFNKKCKNYKRYGQRGITVDSAWLKFENFIHDMGECPTGCTLDRIDNNKNYCKTNCKWSTRKEQARNTSKNITKMFQGKLRCMSEIAEISGIEATVLINRCKLGWSLDRAIAEPIKGRE